MPRLSNSLPKYRKHKASGQAVVTLSGTDHYLGPHGTKASKVEYDRLVSEWLAAGRPPSVAAVDELSISELILRYWRHAQKRYVKNGTPTSELHLVQMALKPVRELYGRTAVAEFGPVALKSVRSKLIEKDWSRGVVNDGVMRIRRMFRWGVAEQLVAPHVLEALRAVEGLRRGSGEARETGKVQPIADSVIELTLPQLPEVVADMVRFQRFTGCRPIEVCILRPCDLDRTEEVWTYRPKSHKTEHHGRDRVVFIGPKAQEVLLRYLVRDAESYCFCPADSEAKRRAQAHAERKTPLSCGNKPGSSKKKRGKRRPRRPLGDRYTTHSYRRAIVRACEQADIDKWSPNRLRHTAATEIRRQFGLEHAQVTLGHSQVNVTEIYAERDHLKGIAVAKAIG